MDCRVVTFQNESECNGYGTSTGGGEEDKNLESGRNDSDDSNELELYCMRAIRIDELSRLLFPLSFLVFNVFYWGYYTQFSK